MTDKRTVAIIAPDFPPSSLPSAIRPRLFANHLAALGWSPVVIATSPEFYDAPIDPDNERLVDSSVEVIRTPALRTSITRRFGLGDLGIRSLWHNWSALCKLVRARRVDLVFISVPPNVTMLLGRIACQQYGVPYVLDYQDPWVTEAWWHVPASQRPPKWPLVWAMARALEPVGVGLASALTGVSEGTTEYAASLRPGISRTEIPFGAEPAEFDFLRAHPRRNPVFDPADGCLHITYAGAVVPGMFPALRALFVGIRDLLDREDGLGARIRVHFVGTSYSAGRAEPRVLSLAGEAGIGAVTTEQTSRVDYLSALQIMLDSSVVLILGSDERHYSPSKIFACACSGRPVLAVLHEGGPGPELLSNVSRAAVVTYGDNGPGPRHADSVSTQLHRLLTTAGDGALSATRYEGFTARAMTAKLVAVFDEVISRDGLS